LTKLPFTGMPIRLVLEVAFLTILAGMLLLLINYRYRRLPRT